MAHAPDTRRDDVQRLPRANTRGGGRRALILGLLLPGGGQLALGDLPAAIAVLFGVLFLWLSAVLEFVVPNYDGYPAPLNLLEAFGRLTAPLAVLPQLVVAVIFAVALHIGAAAFAARSPAAPPVAANDPQAGR